ncbi:fumarate hydratase C-terminal domain-containing protein [Actinomadura sp. KC216]|uniref:fumarate hydratase C-terminal domain-containing protein n=1 Tax=Actinomadura sp. KC216 TaxID=2530370 RepID=UPI0014051736|nr:fumarate hydratase C-terminal domain-containing protein [Actinomadura sp. KC216]
MALKPREIHLTTPISEEDVRGLRLLDRVYLSGTLWGIRDANLRRHLDEGVPLPDGVDYHDHPVLHEGSGYRRRDDGEWELTSGMGATTSTRMERWMSELITRYQCRVIWGKGGLREGSTRACREQGCVYVNTVGGAAAYYDERVKIRNVFWPDLTSQAVLELEVVNYGPGIVTIDCHGNNHNLQVLEQARDRRAARPANGAPR